MVFTRACALGELTEDVPLAAEVDGVEVALVCTAGQYYAIRDECSHASVPLSEGDVYDGGIECYLHGSSFDLVSGKPTSLPATEKVPVYAVRVEGDDLLVDVSAPTN